LTYLGQNQRIYYTDSNLDGIREVRLTRPL